MDDIPIVFSAASSQLKIPVEAEIYLVNLKQKRANTLMWIWSFVGQRIYLVNRRSWFLIPALSDC